jgi:nucleoside-diphosphate-sugar epimerase
VSWLVTGASGFVGGHVAQLLVERGERVRVLVRATSDTAVLDELELEQAIGDLDDAAAVHAAMDGVERVVHCAALASDWGPAAAFWRANVQGTQHVVDAARACGVQRLVHVSTTDVYGYPGAAVDEDAPCRVRGFAYGDSKIEAERVVWEAHGLGLPVAVVRPASVWGPRSHSFVTEIVELLQQGLMLHIGGGSAVAGLGYVRNVADALLLVATHDAAVGRVYNVHDGAATTWREYVDALADIAGTERAWLSLPHRPTYVAAWAMERVWGAARARSRPLLTRVAVDLLGTDQSFSIKRIRDELGWRPEVSFDEGMRAVGEWLSR